MPHRRCSTPLLSIDRDQRLASGVRKRPMMWMELSVVAATTPAAIAGN
jgi:hypothetical protein